MKKGRIRLSNINAYVMLMVLIVISMILTWVIPSGSYDRVLNEATGKMVVDPDSFRYIENVKVGFFDMFVAIPRGLQSSAAVIMFIFFVSGATQIMRGTGALDAGVATLVSKFKDKGTVALCVISIVMGLLGSVFGFAQQLIPVIPLGVALAEGLGYDRVTGFHIIKTTSWVGFAAATFNPATVGISQEIAELPLYSGWGYRLVCFTVFMIIGIIFIIKYANKVKNNPQASILTGYEGNHQSYEMPEDVKLTPRQTAVIYTLCGGVLVMVFGSVKWSWGTTELSALFFGLGILMGIVGGLTPNEIAKEFTKGLSSIAFGAIVVGFSRAIVLVLEDGAVLDTIIYYLTSCIEGAGTVASASIIFIIHSLINFFIGSGSGQATAAMPIMVPTGDILGLSRQTSVLAFQFGDGITNMFWPSMVYYLTFADIPYDRWAKHIFKLVLILTGVGCVMLTIAVLINYGPY